MLALETGSHSLPVPMKRPTAWSATFRWSIRRRPVRARGRWFCLAQCAGHPRIKRDVNEADKNRHIQQIQISVIAGYRDEEEARAEREAPYQEANESDVCSAPTIEQ